MALWNQAHTAKHRALLVVYAGLEALCVGVQVNADAARREALGGANADNAGIAFDKRHLRQFGEVVHLGHQQFTEPRGNNAITVKVFELVGVLDLFGVRPVFGA